MRPTYSPDVLISSTEMQSCFLIRYGQFSGTAFLYHEHERSFFITANHTLASARLGDSILISRSDDWQSFVISGLWRDIRNYDCCAFTIESFGVSGDRRTKTGGMLFLGEPLKFLGFPHGLAGNYPGQGFPTPLVRTAYFSGVISVENLEITVLDGFNNPGFSGGPIYLTHENETSLFGVISGYRTEKISHSRVYRRDEDSNEEEVFGLYTKPNSGMINAISIERLKESLISQVDGSLAVK